jgi:hypothetical protein
MGVQTGKVIEARAIRKTSNAIELAFLDKASDDALAVARQGAADGLGSKAAVLFGFKNGGVGTHVVTYRDGSVMHVKSGEKVPTEVTQPDGVTLCTIERGDAESIARASGGTTVVRFVGRAEGVNTPDAFMLLIEDAAGRPLGSLDIIRRSGGWEVFTDLYWELTLWHDRAAPLKLPFLGARVAVNRDLSQPERDAIVAGCVDIVIGLRPYVKEMS